ncbi:MAG: hypothetical protein QMC83_07335 [Thermodesulfovibrionales bacterium]|nr:hypothetical protein [Thermodesulfovibrionales bacterium]
MPSSIQGLYEEIGRNYRGFTVPAINIRGLTYDVAKTMLRKAQEMNVGALIFEIVRSEIGYTKQRPLEYATTILAAAVKEGLEGPVFIQGDHFQLVRKSYLSDSDAETEYVKGLITEAIDAEFYNIDEEQYIYSTRKKGLGPLKKRWWDLPLEVRRPIMKELESKLEVIIARVRSFILTILSYIFS